MRIIFLAIALLICTNTQAQIIRAEPFYVSPEVAVSGNLLLDDYPGAAVAYSLRKLDKDYTGSAIRVRRSSDNTEQDIGFVNNYLDTASMKTFVGANNGFVVTWYNQADSSGVFGTNNATQTTGSAQPQIIASGVINRDGADICITFDGSDDAMASTKAVLSNDNFSIFVIANGIAQNNKAIIAQHDGTTATGRTQFLNTGGTGSTDKLGIFFNNGTSYSYNSTAVAFNSNQTLLYAESNDAGTTKIAINGTIETAITSQQWTPLNTRTRIGCIGAFGPGFSANFYSGKLSEILIYPTLQSSRTSIETNINSFYSIY